MIVAVIDTGLDYFHPDMPPSNVWRNPREKLDGRDDDGNGYVDDAVGWNFVDRTNDPMDKVGHGTHVAGIIAASLGNNEGISGINPTARIMPLKVIDRAGRAPGLRIAEAIVYAVENGARVINLSLGGHGISPVERAAIKFADRNGTVIVVAAGNAGRDVATNGLAGLPNVILVAATDHADRRVQSSNYGDAIDLAAPGVDVLSLRAGRTDFQKDADVRGYVAGSAIVGPTGRYYRASGTSFAAPFVSGVASLLIARNPALAPGQVKRILLMSARDIETPGWDRLTGYGLLDATAALASDPKFHLDARLDAVEFAADRGGRAIRVSGRVTADRMTKAWIEIGKGDRPLTWRNVANVSARPRTPGFLADLPLAAFRGAARWTIRLVAEHDNGRRREARHTVTLRASVAR